jgi:uncharacterized membrane protein
MRRKKRKYVGIKCHRCGRRIPPHKQVERILTILKPAYRLSAHGDTATVVICPACDRFYNLHYKTFWIAFWGLWAFLAILAAVGVLLRFFES